MSSDTGNQQPGYSNEFLWFTTTMSTHMEGKNGGSMFAGLYECELDRQTGKCGEPSKIVDVYNPVDGEHYRGLDVMNVRINDAHSHLFAGYYVGHHNSFEILRAPLINNSPPVALQSYFRTPTEISNSNCLMQCCKEEEGHHNYYQMEPRDYTIHDGEIFISWDGFYQNCADDFASQIGLKWTVGISKIKQTSECVLTDGTFNVNFEDCTEPVAIMYHDTSSTARNKVLGYSGFQASYAPSGKRMFWVSALGKTQRTDGLRLLDSEAWVMAEGESHFKNPNALQVFGRLEVDHLFIDEPVDDVASMKLRKNRDTGIPDGLCRTAYNAGVACYSLSIDENDKVSITNDKLIVGREEVKESCTIPPNDHYPITKILPPVTTGLEVVWDPTTGGDDPEMVFFGCYGEINNHGNMTTAFRNGTIIQTLPGAYSGSILFGPDEAVQEMKYDCFPPEMFPSTGSANDKSSLFLKFGFVTLFLGLVAGLLAAKRKIVGRTAVHYDRLDQHIDEPEIQFGSFPMQPSEATAYVELQSKPAIAAV